MRIGVNCFLLQPSIGGLKQYFQTLFRELLSTDNSNEYVFFYFDHNVSELEALNNDRWKQNAIHLSDQLEVNKHLNQIDLYFCPFGALWPIPLPIPTVVTIVDLQEKYFPDFFTAQDHWNRDYYYYGSTHQADATITISQFSKSSIVKYHSVDSDRIHVVYLCADSRYKQSGNNGQPITFQLPERFIFYPANHWLHKNHDCILRALQQIKIENNIDIPVVFTGFKQTNGYPLQEKITEYGVTVVILEFVSIEQMVYLYRHASMLCFPSLFEGFGIPLVEAMHTGCPIVCSNTSSIPEVVGNAALLFDPKEPEECASRILDIWNNPSVRGELIARGFDQALNFSSNKLAQDHLQIFNVARQQFSYLRYLKNKYIFNPAHNKRLKNRQPAGN